MDEARHTKPTPSGRTLSVKDLVASVAKPVREARIERFIGPFMGSELEKTSESLLVARLRSRVSLDPLTE
jgi:hypothetical protein